MGISEEETIKCANLVQQFDAVSVIEESAVDLCKQFLNVAAQWVLDPTFLLSKEDYVQLFDKKKLPKRSGLYSYILDENDEIDEVINQVANLLNLEHFTNQPKWRRNDKTGKTLEDLQYPSVEGWLKGFHDAEFIVTNSFHGTVFAIIFNKPFLTIINNQRGAARFYSLLEQFGLENRIITTADTSMIPEIVNCTLDFSEVNIKLNELKKISSKFLLDNLS
jgi:exopolysaccharide biosynthesis predicted pyruvyltransferase EpsI